MHAGHRFDIDRAKGLAILLVVFGHLMADGYPPGNAWYDTAKDIVYSFHMPFFMYLSGYVFSLAGKQRIEASAYWNFLRERALRLLVPFALFGLLIVVGKYVSHFFLYVDDPPRALSTGIGELVLDTRRSPALSIWYVYVLFLYSAAMPLLWCTGLRWRGAMLLGVVLFTVPATDLFYLDRVAGYFLFFAIGGWMAVERDRIEPWFRRALPFWLILFAVTLFSEWTALPAQARLLICGLAAIPALHGLVQSRLFARDRLLLSLGDYAFTIYLLNTIAIGLAKAGYLKVAPFWGPYATFALALFFVAGTLVPILIRRYLAERVPVLARLMR
ncbi:MAG TPA: acyltransferase [Rhizomicrobium sp.]|jgi:fucose 4-O-acetylase-like acetyltransferase